MLYIPTVSGFTLAEDTTVPSLLTIHVPSIQSGYHVPHFLPNSDQSPIERLKWELFFLLIGTSPFILFSSLLIIIRVSTS